MVTQSFTSAAARDIVWSCTEGWKTISEETIGSSRWSIHMAAILQGPDGRFWQVAYDVGATEMQDQDPFEYEDTVEFVQVEKRLVEVEKFVPVQDAEGV